MTTHADPYHELPKRLQLYFAAAQLTALPPCYAWAIMAGPECCASDRGVVPAPKGHAHPSEHYCSLYAVGKGLRHLLDAGWKGRLEVRGPSRTVVALLSHRWECRSAALRPLVARCHAILGALGGDWRALYVPQEQSAHTEQLLRMAFDEAGKEKAS